MNSGLESSNLHKKGNIMAVETCGELVFHEGGLCGHDGTDCRPAGREESEYRLLHALKMEAVGQLAGGMANDINNILTAVIGYEQLLISRLDDDPKGKYLAEKVMELAWKMSEMTHNLLSFSRKQTIFPGNEGLPQSHRNTEIYNSI